MDLKLLHAIIDNAIIEDIGDGDHTSLATITKGTIGKAHLLVKEAGIIAGVNVGNEVFKRIDSTLFVEILINDGTIIKPGDIVLQVSGSAHSILQAERLVLNIMQRMSGIATNTYKYTEKLTGLNTKVIDTRKTTPGLRILEKEAVLIGGGGNHRMGLYDMILIKDNHIDFAGGIENALNHTKNYLRETGKNLKIEIEARTLSDIEKILSIGGVHRIMLDNFSLEYTKKAVTLIAGKYETESSGGITLNALRAYAECGVDYISAGALTHHIKSIDLSLKAIK